MLRYRRLFSAAAQGILLILLAGGVSAAGPTEYVLADRSASITLPSTWRAVGERGSVIARGPEGLAALGISGRYSCPGQWSLGSDHVGQSPYLTPAEFIPRGLAPALASQAGLAASSAVLVRSIPARGFTYPAALADVDLQVGRTQWRAVMLVATWQVYGRDRWGFYVSGVAAPESVFDISFPELWRVFASFRAEWPYRAGHDSGALAMDLRQLGGPRPSGSME